MSNDAYGEALANIQDRVDAAILERNSGKTGFVNRLKRGEREDVVIYSAYENDIESDIPIDNLDEIPHKGTFVIVRDYTSFWDYTGSGGIYISDPVTDPTWLEIAVLANESIHVTGDYHHVFLESVDVVDDGKALKLWLGS